MKILHLPVAFLPWTTGGREVYSYGLAKALSKLGVDNHIAFHQDPSRLEPVGLHNVDGLPVTILPQLEGLSARSAKYKRTFDNLPGFKELLESIRPDIVHFHDQGGGASLSHLDTVKEFGAKTVVTYHTPGQSCSQAELRFCAQTICDGYLDVNRCTACRLTVAGLPYRASKAMSYIPFAASALIMSDSRIARLLSARTKTKMFIDSFNEFVTKVDKVHVHAQWVRDMMKLNHIEDRKLFFARTAGTLDVTAPVQKDYSKGGTINFVFIGRCEFIKGIHVLIEAVKLLPVDAPVKVYFWGPYWSDSYGKDMMQRIAGDPRFVTPELVPHDQLRKRLGTMDAILVPSIWLETGPLSLLDAMTAGVPAIGSRLGGIKEIVRDNENGLLFEQGNAQDLAGKLSEVIKEPAKLNHLRQGIGTVRTMHHLATELMDLYKNL